MPIASAGIELLKPGDTVPDAPLVDQDGRKIRFAAFIGRPVVMTFIYTRCPLPTFCPLMDRHFAQIQRTLQRDPALGGARLVTVSFDPAADTPPVLKRHAKSLGADTTRWTFLTGDRAEIDRFAARFCRLDQDFQIRFDFILTDVFGEPLGAQREFESSLIFVLVR